MQAQISRKACYLQCHQELWESKTRGHLKIPVPEAD